MEASLNASMVPAAAKQMATALPADAAMHTPDAASAANFHPFRLTQVATLPPVIFQTSAAPLQTSSLWRCLPLPTQWWPFTPVKQYRPLRSALLMGSLMYP